MGVAATILFAAVVVAVIYSIMRKPKAVEPDPAAADSRLPPPVAPQGNGGPLNPEK